jgi:hypothetical protein
LNETTRKLPWLRALALLIPAAILAVAVTVGPSFAGSLTHKFVTKKAAERTYLAKKSAKAKYAKADAVPLAPVAKSASSSVVYGPVSSYSTNEIPQARVTFKAPVTSLVSVTFSGTSTCTATKSGVGCPIQLLLDGSPMSTSDPKRPDTLNFDVSTTASAAPVTHSTTQTTVVTPGQHEVKVRYAGAGKDPSINFKLTSWNLVAVAYPDPKERPEPAE